jgi:hypothetical protein
VVWRRRQRDAPVVEAEAREDRPGLGGEARRRNAVRPAAERGELSLEGAETVQRSGVIGRKRSFSETAALAGLLVGDVDADCRRVLPASDEPERRSVDSGVGLVIQAIHAPAERDR